MGRRLLSSVLAGLLAVLSACAEGSSTEPPPAAEVPFPVGVAVHPAGFALVVTSNFDMRYRSGTLQVIDVNRLAERIESGSALDGDNRDLIIEDRAVAIPSFAASIELDSDGQAGLAAVTCRQTSQLLLFDLEVTGAAGDGPQIEVSCWAGEDAGSDQLPSCHGSRSVLELPHDDPFDILMQPQLADENDDWSARSWSLWLSYLRSGQVTEIQVPEGRPQPDIEQLPQVVREVDTGSQGVNELARSPLNGYIYATSRFNTSQSNPIQFFDPDEAENPALHSLELFRILLGNETRGIGFGPDGQTLGVIVRNPDLLAFLDTTPGSDGVPVNRVTGQVVLEDNPAHLEFVGENMVLVSDPESDTLALVDSSSMRLVQMSDDICRGPYDLDLWEKDGRHWALVACFEEDVVAVVDMDPDSETFFQVLAKVGKAREER